MTETLEIAVSRLLTEIAQTVVMPRWRNLAAGDIAEKTGPEDIVTVADREAEARLAAALARLLPGSVVVGEEAVAADPDVLGRFRGADPIWVIDPIDGTSAFAAGAPEFALMVALVEASEAVAGWIHAPALGLTTWGGRRFAAAWQSTPGAAARRLAPPAIPGSLRQMTGILGRRNISEARRRELQAREVHFRALEGVACAGIDYQRLARGDVQFAVYNKSEPWDHLPGLAILSVLGFEAAKYDGAPYRPGDNSGGLIVAPGTAALRDIARVMLG